MPRIHLKPTGPGDGAAAATERIKPVSDILDWISSVFGFQVTCLLMNVSYDTSTCSSALGLVLMF